MSLFPKSDLSAMVHHFPKNGDYVNMQSALLKTLVVKYLQAKNVYERGGGVIPLQYNIKKKML